MTKVGCRLDDLGDGLTWPDLRDFVTHLPQDSALYRAKHPASWWWTPDIDFLGAIVTAIQWGNWQRGGGKGDKPRNIERPIDRPKTAAGPITAEELAARKKALMDSMERTPGGN
jgi:hypothetical protein